MRAIRAFVGFVIIVAAVVVGLIVGIGFYLSPQGVLKPSDAIVVISGGETELRVKEGVRLFQQGIAPVIIMSGAARDAGTSNAETMRDIAVSLNVPVEKILLEPNAKDTIGNAKYVGELIAQNQIHSIVLVTSPYHQRRAYLTFRRALGKDFVIINHSALDSAWRKNGWWSSLWARKITISELQKILYLHFFVAR
jgi:uncharacterized SAM-binding protein YcdF (DUF218 family)